VLRDSRTGTHARRLHRGRKEVRTPRFQPGDYVKAEFKDEARASGCGWRWTPATRGAGVLFGRLDNEQLLRTGLHLGDELAVGHDPTFPF